MYIKKKIELLILESRGFDKYFSEKILTEPWYKKTMVCDVIVNGPIEWKLGLREAVNEPFLEPYFILLLMN